MAIESVKKTNKQDLIFSAGAGVCGGLLSASAGAYKFFQNGIPSDVFVKQVEKNIINKTDRESVKTIKAFQEYEKNLDKAKSLGDFVDASINLNLKYYDTSDFTVLKSIVKHNLVHGEGFSESVVQNPNLMLDYLLDIKGCENIGELKTVMTSQLDKTYPGWSIEQIRDSLKADLNHTKQQLNIVHFDDVAKAAIGCAYDVKKEKFVFNKENITKEMFDIVKNTAQKMQFKSAALYGAAGTLIVGGATYLIIKLSDLCRGIKKSKVQTDKKV